MRVSIVIDNYNYAGFVAKAIESSLAQTHADVEVIVVDDGSTDGSVDVINGYADRIKLISKPNGGQGSAYNVGFAASTGGAVIFLDADDWLYPEAAARIVAAWHGGVSKVQFPLLMVDRDGNSLGRQVPHHMHDDRDALALVREFGTYGSPPGSGNAYSAVFLRQVLPMDEAQWRLAADSVPILLAPAYGKVVTLNAALGAYRLHRPVDDGSLLMNNAPTGLWSEYDRADSTKRFVEQSLSRLNKQPRLPQLLAPWEARLAAICVRFGGPQVGTTQQPTKLARLALKSVWHWPMLGVGMKLMLSVWMMGVMLLPRPLALRLAQMHRRSAGAPSAA